MVFCGLAVTQSQADISDQGATTTDLTDDCLSPPVAAGQANPQLLAIDDRLFTSSGQVPTSGYPPEAEAGSLQSRSTTGYILDQKVVQAYRKVGVSCTHDRSHCCESET